MKKPKTFKDLQDAMYNDKEIYYPKNDIYFKHINAIIIRNYSGAYGDDLDKKMQVELQDKKSHSITIVPVDEILIVE